MNDAEYLFKAEVREKSITARSSHNFRKRRSGIGKCSLPSDRLTKKQLQNMNGKEYTMDINKPYTWAELAEFSDDMKVAYLNSVAERFNPSMEMWKKMLRIGHEKVHRIFSELGVNYEFKARGANPDGVRFHKSTKKEWEEFLGIAPIEEVHEPDACVACVGEEDDTEEPKPFNPLGQRMRFLKSYNSAVVRGADLDSYVRRILYDLSGGIDGMIDLGKEYSVQFVVEEAHD